MSTGITLHHLPPPVIFTHNEILHAISLPPLATFLTGLSQAEHLVKLNDILDRFRTPKSYHRVDVRIVESSELPPAGYDGAAEAEPTNAQADQSDPDGGNTQQDQRAEDEAEKVRWKKERGDPVILSEGMSMADYLASQTTLEPPAAPVDVPIPEEIRSLEDPSLYNRPEMPPPNTTEPPLPSSPSPKHQLPPTGPPRRIRELRLDLRTLDAAALFALETWRRELLGLEKLDMKHPDSIWYKDPTLPPTPSPEPETETPAKTKKGRPRKVRPSEAQLSEELAPAPKANEEDYESLAAALQEREQAQEQAPAEEANDEELPASTIMEALNSLEALVGPEEGEPELSEPPEDVSPTRSPSPDVILNDLFDSNEARDPDFIPPPSPRPAGPSSGTKRNRPRTSEPVLIDLTNATDGEAFDPAVLLPLKSHKRKRKIRFPTGDMENPAETLLLGGTSILDDLGSRVFSMEGVAGADTSQSSTTPVIEKKRSVLEGVMIDVTPKRPKKRVSLSRVRFAELEKDGEGEVAQEDAPGLVINTHKGGASTTESTVVPGDDDDWGFLRRI